MSQCQEENTNTSQVHQWRLGRLPDSPIQHPPDLVQRWRASTDILHPPERTYTHPFSS
ncbi:uncharacterized protein LACBIDRAFT_318517 [Laccaria bicolor S238N-H82]|uniref:Predicted protein n=1 Tax=Laccaria bicolor (strain S238N-H82 / ATCC MYA-4686) TaxID=486041 RepID=B0E2K8_LACBS|nr:uncharacterized protein LACBIDRAFT_318517 [Laccaria bicolor S238N-H82]EDQ98920.1 predicted protein [Laccaria bicolor S238N-H82]|eukprot:XP_001890431.1 predicted protein [Laccaria bicolor S238N-H82]